MQAIRTQYLGPTDKKPARVRAACASGFIVVSYDDELTSDQNHADACKALRDKVGWRNLPPMIAGEYAGDMYWVFVQGASNEIPAVV